MSPSESEYRPSGLRTVRKSTECGAGYDGDLRIAAAIVALIPTASALSPPPLRIAAAADLQFALKDLVREFHAGHSGVDVQTAFGSSGNFYAEIANGAPFDLFLSADSEYPRKLIEQKLAAPDSFFLYATGHLALWAPKGSPVDLERLGIKAVTDPSVKHVAIANPQHAPYGRAAEEALRASGLYQQAAPKLVLGENVAQAFEFAQSGAAELGIVALSLALSPEARERGRYREVPARLYPKLEQAGAIPAHASNPEAARQFRAYLLSEPARRTLARYGF